VFRNLRTTSEFGNSGKSENQIIFLPFSSIIIKCHLFFFFSVFLVTTEDRHATSIKKKKIETEK